MVSLSPQVAKASYGACSLLHRHCGTEDGGSGGGAESVAFAFGFPAGALVLTVTEGMGEAHYSFRNTATRPQADRKSVV